MLFLTFVAILQRFSLSKMLRGSDGKSYYAKNITDYEMLNFNNLPFNS